MRLPEVVAVSDDRMSSGARGDHDLLAEGLQPAGVACVRLESALKRSRSLLNGGHVSGRM
jgi:hypothetical protein